MSHTRIDSAIIPMFLSRTRSAANLTVPVGKSSTFLIFPKIFIIFSYCSSNFHHSCPHFGLPGGQPAGPGRPLLRHCQEHTKLSIQISKLNFSFGKKNFRKKSVLWVSFTGTRVLDNYTRPYLRSSIVSFLITLVVLSKQCKYHIFKQCYSAPEMSQYSPILRCSSIWDPLYSFSRTLIMTNSCC